MKCINDLLDNTDIRDITQYIKDTNINIHNDEHILTALRECTNYMKDELGIDISCGTCRWFRVMGEDDNDECHNPTSCADNVTCDYGCKFWEIDLDIKNLKGK